MSDSISMQLEPHPYAAIFPMMGGVEFADLANDIKSNGLREPVWLYEGKILDGRNRAEACVVTGTPLVTREYDGDDPVGFVLSLNLHRRHLDSGQRACVAVELERAYAAEAKKRQASAVAESNRKRAQAENRAEAGEIPYVEKIPHMDRTRDQAAKAIGGTNGRYVSDAKKLEAKDPELFKKVKSGEVKLVAATRETKEREREAKREENRQQVAKAAKPETVEGVYSTIVIDPPWDWGDEGDSDQLGRARPDYATMSIQELMALPVGKLAAPDAHLYCWITNRSLRKGFALLEAWGFRYVTMVTWAKPSFGLGNYFRGQTEHLLFGVRGSLPLARKDVGTVFSAARGKGGHSSKPDEAYALIESCSPSPRIDMFSRDSRQGWVTWGQDNAA